MPKDMVNQKKNQNLWYKRNADKTYEAVKRRRNEIRKWLRDYKTQRGCKECGKNHPAILDLHHVNGDKDLNLSSATVRQWSQIRLEAEVAKCIVLCSNCHRILHFNEKVQQLENNNQSVA